MSAKSAVLLAATLAVVVLAVYLFIQVRATPAQTGATQVARPVPTAPSATAEPTPIAAAEPAPGGKPDTRPLGAARKAPTMGTEVDGPPPPTQMDNERANMKLENMMELANKAYDSQEFDQATAIATKVLSKEPNNIRMLRIIVSANCIQGDSAVAQAHYERLPKFDREQMRSRCDRYGVSFKEPAE